MSKFSYMALLLPSKLLPKLQPTEPPASTAPGESTKDQAAFRPERSEEQAVLSAKFDNLKGTQKFCARFARYTRCLHGEENVLQTPSLIWRGICHRQPQQTNSQAAKLWKTAKPSEGLEIGGGIASNVVNVDPPDPLTATLWDVQLEFQVCQAAKQSYEKEKDFSVT